VLFEALRARLKGSHRVLGKTFLTATERHLPYEITQCYLSPDTSTPRRQAGTCFTYHGGMAG